MSLSDSVDEYSPFLLTSYQEDWAKLGDPDKNSPCGIFYLKILGFNYEIWSADRIAFLHRNKDTAFTIDSQSHIIYKQHRFTVISKGFIQLDNGGTYKRLQDYPDHPFEGRPYFPIAPPNHSSQSIDTCTECLTNLSELETLVEGFYGRADVYCFDFDNTLTQKYLTGIYKNNLDDKGMFKLLIEPDKVRRMLEELLRRNKKVYIVTFSDGIAFRNSIYCGVELVSKALQLILPKRWSEIRIIAYNPSLYGHPNNKNGHLKIAAEECQVSPDQLMLIDDSKYNIDMARTNGYQTLYTPQGVFR